MSAKDIRVTREGDTIAINAPLIGGERWMLFRSDAHRDHPCSNAAMEKRHLDLALERQAIGVDGGDLNCVMQGFHDQRRTMGDTKKEHDGEDYYDRVHKSNVRDLKPYRSVLKVLCRGNHESSVIRHANTDLTQRLVDALNAMGANCVAGGYRNYIRLTLRDGKRSWSKLIYHVHGSGGGSPVTRGVIATNRRAVYLRDADFVFSGHTHHGWLVPIVRETVNADGSKGRHTQYHVQCPSYKDVLSSRDMGWEIEREFAPLPLGAWFIRFFVDGGELRQDIVFAE